MALELGTPAVEAIRVGIRVCPSGVSTSSAEKQVVRCEGDRTVFAEAFELNVDAAMDSRDPSGPQTTSQADVYELFGRRAVDHAFDGYSSAIFAYGQTGTGKTYTIMGEREPASERGLLPRILEDIFQRGAGEAKVNLQMLEVYNEKLRDLLAGKPPAKANGTKDARQPPEVRVHPKHGVYVTGAMEPSIASLDEALKLLERGDKEKSVAETAMNRKSSRAHTVVKLHVEIKASDGSSGKKSDVFVVDLAGRENEKTSQVTGERMKELICINKSLFHLSNCIQSLGGDDAKKLKRKPSASDMSKFRNSVLTLLLRGALTGNSRSSMIGTIHPAASRIEETMKTLRVAAAVKNIKLTATKSAVVDKDALVDDLRREIQQLKQQLKLQASGEGRFETAEAAEKGDATPTTEASSGADEAVGRLAAELEAQQAALERKRAELSTLEAEWEAAAQQRAADEQCHREAQEAAQQAAASERRRLAAEAEAWQAELERKQSEVQALSGLREERQAEAQRAASAAQEEQAALDKKKEALRALEVQWEEAAAQRAEEERRRREAQHAEVARALREKRRLAKEAEAQQADLEAKQQELQALQRQREEQEAAAAAAAAECELRRQELQALSDASPSSGSSESESGGDSPQGGLEAELDRKMEELRRLEVEREEAEQRRAEEERLLREERERLEAGAAAQRLQLEQRAEELRAAEAAEAARQAQRAEAARREAADAQEAERQRREAQKAEVRAAEQRGWQAAEAAQRHAELERQARQLERCAKAVLTMQQPYSVATPLRSSRIGGAASPVLPSSPVLTERRELRRGASKEALSTEVSRMTSSPPLTTTITTTTTTYVASPPTQGPSPGAEKPFTGFNSKLPVHTLAKKFLVENSQGFRQ